MRVHLLARFFLQADQLRQRRLPAVRSLTAVPADVMRNGALLVAALRRTSHRAALGAPRCLSRVCFACVFFMLESGGVDSALARVAFLDTDLLSSPLSLVTVALLPLIFLHFSFVCIVGWARV